MPEVLVAAAGVLVDQATSNLRLLPTPLLIGSVQVGLVELLHHAFSVVSMALRWLQVIESRICCASHAVNVFNIDRRLQVSLR